MHFARRDSAIMKYINDPLPPLTEINEATLRIFRLYLHYVYHRCFLEEGQLLDPANCARIAHIPTQIVHGRYDTCCSIDNARRLHRALPGSEIHIIENA